MEVFGANFLIYVVLNTAGLWHVLNILTQDIRSHNCTSECAIYTVSLLQYMQYKLLV